MARKVKCPRCGQFNDKEITVLHNQRYYCEQCFKVVQQETNDYKDLIAYVCNLYEIEIPEGMMLKQIKEYKDTYKYSYKGMRSTLYYFYEIEEGHNVDDSRGLGIIPYVYKDALKFYTDKKKVKDSVNNNDVQQLQENKKVININKCDMKKEINYEEMVYIDIDDL